MIDSRGRPQWLHRRLGSRRRPNCRSALLTGGRSSCQSAARAPRGPSDQVGCRALPSAAAGHPTGPVGRTACPTSQTRPAARPPTDSASTTPARVKKTSGSGGSEAVGANDASSASSVTPRVQWLRSWAGDDLDQLDQLRQVSMSSSAFPSAPAWTTSSTRARRSSPRTAARRRTLESTTPPAASSAMRSRSLSGIASTTSARAASFGRSDLPWAPVSSRQPDRGVECG